MASVNGAIPFVGNSRSGLKNANAMTEAIKDRFTFLQEEGKYVIDGTDLGHIAENSRTEIKDALMEASGSKKRRQSALEQLFDESDFDVDVVDIEQKIDLLPEIENPKKRSVAEDEIWLDLYGLSVKRGADDPAYTWLESKFKEHIDNES